MLGGLGTLVQIGFALAFGVLLDTFIIRPFMVPAFTLMVWRQGQEKSATAIEKPSEIAALTPRPVPVSRLATLRLEAPTVPRGRVA
jgi:RND superfamily putative drug exporter